MSKEREPVLGILASGEGTTAEGMVLASYSGELKLPIGCIIFSNPKAGGINRAMGLHVPNYVISPRDFPQDDPKKRVFYGRAINEVFSSHGVTAFSQNGHMVKTPLIVINSDQYDENGNQHGAPKYETAGTMGLQSQYVMIGIVRETGRNEGTHAIIHEVIENYDEGKTFAVTPNIEIRHGDTPETLQARVKIMELPLQIYRWNKYALGEKLDEVLEHRYIRPGEEELLSKLISEAKLKYPHG